MDHHPLVDWWKGSVRPQRGCSVGWYTSKDVTGTYSCHMTPQASTGFTPFELLFGRRPRGLLDVIKEACKSQVSNPKANIPHKCFKAGASQRQQVTVSTLTASVVSLSVEPLLNLSFFQGWLLVEPYWAHRRNLGGKTRVHLERLYLTVKLGESTRRSWNLELWIEVCGLTFSAYYHHDPHEENQKVNE